MKFENITEAFEFLRMDGSASVALIDCMNSFALGKDELEKHFDNHLWLDASEDEYAPFSSEEAQQYYIELARIEEFLVDQGLI
jgi:hypothetical protein